MVKGLVDISSNNRPCIPAWRISITVDRVSKSRGASRQFPPFAFLFTSILLVGGKDSQLVQFERRNAKRDVAIRPVPLWRGWMVREATFLHSAAPACVA